MRSQSRIAALRRIALSPLPLPTTGLLALVALSGCFKPNEERSQLDFTDIPYNNPSLTVQNVVISAFDVSLDCPTGEDARFFLVYPTDAAGPLPVAIVLHSGAFDYVTEPDPASALAGSHYRTESRLDRGWAISKVWETLGLYYEQVDPYEQNEGALPAALANAGFAQIYPANCWGDLWHNEQGYQDNEVDVEGFDRNGRTFAYWMMRMVVESDFAQDQGVVFPIQMDGNALYLVGLGEGGRGVTELLTHDNMLPVRGALLDSTPDLLSPYVDRENEYADEVDGLARIFQEENLESIDSWSLYNVAGTTQMPDRLAWLWSTGDPRLPTETMAPTAARLSAEADVWVNTQEVGRHVLVNADPLLAAAAVDYLVNGVVPNRCAGGGRRSTAAGDQCGWVGPEPPAAGLLLLDLGFSGPLPDPGDRRGHRGLPGLPAGDRAGADLPLPPGGRPPLPGPPL